MADEIARLGLAVDSTSTVSAMKDVEALAVAGDKASASANKLSQSWSGMAMSPAQLFAANKGLGNFRREAAEAAAAASRIDDSWKKNLFNTGQLMRANASLREFRAAAQAGATAATKQATSNKVLAASHHQVAKAAVGYTKTAKEMAFATRNLPAQFTDIAVSLQAGQNPLTVLLQQGGQLKDMFGGVGQAVRAMGTYVLGLINPYTVAAAAVAVLGIAYLKGDSEARKLNATLVMQGNALGVTTGDLLSAADGMERFGQSQGAASAALNQAASSGKIFGDSIGVVAQAALNMEREAGQAVEKTVEQFASLSGEPVDAAIKLDEQYKFLTVSVYNQISALEEQGDTMGAAEVAMNALASTMNERTNDIEGNLGTLEKTWRLVANAAKFAWDKMLNIGRETAVSDKIINLNDEIRKLQNPTLGGEYSLMPKAFRDSRIGEYRAQIRGLQVVMREEEEKAAKTFQEEQGRVAALSLAEQAKRGRTNAEKRVVEERQIAAEVTRALAGIVAESEKDRVAQETVIRENGAKAIAAMEKRLADPKKPKEKKSQEAKDAERLLRQRAAEYEQLNTALDRHESTLTAAGEAQDKLSSFEKYAIKTISDLENGHTKLDAAQQAEMKTRIESLRVIDKENIEREKQNKLMAVGADLHKRIADFENSKARGFDADLRGIGMGREQAGLADAMADIQDRATRERIALAEKHGEINAENTAAYLEQLAMINEAEQRQLGNEIAHFERRKQAMGDWKNGARAAMDDIAFEMGDVAGRTKDGFMNAFQSMTSALQSFAQTGKLNIRDFATTVIAELLRIALTIAATKALTAMFGSTAIGGAGSSAEQASFDSWFNANGGAGANAQGAAIAGGQYLTSYALGGPLGGVRTSPTLFSMANGTGLMAEQSPEAIMPLARGPNGKLGVQSTGGGGGSTINVSTVVNVHQDGSSDSSTTADNGKEGKRLGEMLDKRVREIIADERRQGGSLWAMQNGR